LPVLSVLVLFSAFNHWNSWFDGMLYMNRPSKFPLQTYLQTIVVQVDPSRVSDLRDIEDLSTENTRAAQIVLAMIPILCVYPFLQRYFAKGIILGAVKG
jgi:putative aldouronate transport system permease protein